jgi:phosphoglucosamine mutase
MPDNGIKFFGWRWPQAAGRRRDLIERRMGEPWDRPTGGRVGRVPAARQRARAYVEHLLPDLPTRLTGLKVVLDCAHGAASVVSPRGLPGRGPR